MSGRWLVRVTLLVVALVLCELALRFLLFGAAPQSWTFARALRRPELYADVQRSDLYWELQDRWLDGTRRPPDPPHDPALGWISRWIDPATYEHVESALVFDKRPILLFGDSYAQCNTPESDCFQALFASSGLARQQHLLNFGVGGYGLDQTSLLMTRVLERYAQLRPLVLVGILVDDDLDRCRLAFRCWPKPRFELRGGELKALDGPVPTRAEYVAPWRVSMLARLFERGLVPRALSWRLERTDDFDRDTSALAGAIVERMLDDLAQRHVDALFLLFRTEPSTRALSEFDWRTHAVRDVLDRRGAHWLDLGVALRESASSTGVDVGTYFGGSPELAGHYNALGNRVACEAIVAALQREFGLALDRLPLSPAAITAKRLPGEQSAARHEFGLREPFGREDYERLCLRVGLGGPTEIDYDLAGGETRFSASVGLIPLQGVTAGSVELTLLGDGRELEHVVLRRGEARRALAVDVRGVQRLTIRAGDAGDGIEGDWLVPAMPRFQ